MSCRLFGVTLQVCHVRKVVKQTFFYIYIDISVKINGPKLRPEAAVFQVQQEKKQPQVQTHQ